MKPKQRPEYVSRIALLELARSSGTERVIGALWHTFQIAQNRLFLVNLVGNYLLRNSKRWRFFSEETVQEPAGVVVVVAGRNRSLTTGCPGHERPAERHG